MVHAVSMTVDFEVSPINYFDFVKSLAFRAILASSDSFSADLVSLLKDSHADHLYEGIY